MCDLAYILLVDKVEREVLADRTAVGVALSMSDGSTEVELPSIEKQVEALNNLLEAKPEPVSDRDLRNQAFLRAVS